MCHQLEGTWSTSRLPIILSILVLVIGISLGTLREAAGSGGPQPTDRWLMVAESFPWSEDPVAVNYTVPCNSFVYASASWPWSYVSAWWPWGQMETGCGSFFFYYEESLYDNLVSLTRNLKLRGKTVYVVLDPDPVRENCTFLDLYYNETLRVDLEEELSEIMGDLSGLGVDGFVLGDEWPRGLNREEVTTQVLTRHNETYYNEMGLWIRTDPDVVDKEMLAEWFYARAVEAWNQIAQGIRDQYPNIRFGTNFDLVWEPDLASTNVAHWLPSHWWVLVDPGPYDFVVTHFLTRMPWVEGGDDATDPIQIDGDRTLRLQSALDELLDPQTDLGWGLDVYLLLAAHCVYPYVTTPMQMVEEWNVAMGYADRLAGVGFFTFDGWPVEGGWIEVTPIGDSSIEVPLKSDRAHTVKKLLDTCTSSVCLGLGEVELGPDYIVSRIGEEEVLEVTVTSNGYEGNVSIISVLSLTHDSPRLGFEWRSNQEEGSEGFLGCIEAGGELKGIITITTDYWRHVKKGGGDYELRVLVAPSPCRYVSLWATVISNPIVLDLRPIPESCILTAILLIPLYMAWRGTLRTVGSPGP